jgi:uncharacterized membrane protein
VTRRGQEHHFAPFGTDTFGMLAERVARAYGTPRFIIAQSFVVAAWIAVNGFGVAMGWDPYPFILLNLAFSTQAAYAAPLILLAQTRQSDRDRSEAVLAADHRDEIAAAHTAMLAENTELTEQIRALTAEIHKAQR